MLCAGSFSLVFDKQKGLERISVAGARRWLEILSKNRVDWLLENATSCRVWMRCASRDAC